MADTVHARGLQAEVIVRCMALIVRLLRGPASKADLLRLIRRHADYTESPSDKAIDRRLEEDRHRLKEWFGCDIVFDRQAGQYVFQSIDRPLIDVSSDALRGLAFLQQTFSDATVPMSHEVIALVSKILVLLPPERQKEVEHERRGLELDLRSRDKDELTVEVWEAVQQAIAEHRVLEFDYLSPQQADGKLRTHRGEPLRYYFEPTRRHYYLEMYVLESRGPTGSHPINTIWNLRIGRMRNPQLLPDKFFPGNRSPRRYTLTYRLVPQIARLGVTEHFPNSLISYQDDGSAIVDTTSTNLFFDLRTLLHYGPGCQVLGGEESLEQMKIMVKEMALLYE